MCPFRYSNIFDIDACFICFSQELFYAPEVLPYDVSFYARGNKSIAYGPDTASFIYLYEFYGHKNMVTTNRVVIHNTLHEANYPMVHAWSYYRFIEDIAKSMPGFQYKIHQYVPMKKIEAFCDKYTHSPVAMIRHRFQYWRLSARIIVRFLIYRAMITHLFKDFKLNRKIKKQQTHQARA